MPNTTVVVCACMLALFTASVACIGESIDFRGDWEGGQLFGNGNWAGIERVSASHAAYIVNDTVRQGRYAARFEVRRGDYVNSGERSEVASIRRPNGSVDLSENIPGTIYFYAFSVYLHPVWVRGTSWTILFQMHGPWDGLYAGASPSFGFHAHDNYYISINGGDKQNGNLYENLQYRFNNYVSGGGELMPGKWDDFVIEIQWDIYNRSHVNAWRRKWGQGELTWTQVAAIRNVSTLMYDDSGTVNGNGTGGLTRSSHYWKFGIYRGSANVTNEATIVHLDGMTRAKTFEDAAYGAFGDVPSPTTVDSAGTAPQDSTTSVATTGTVATTGSATTRDLSTTGRATTTHQEDNDSISPSNHIAVSWLLSMMIAIACSI